MKRIMCVIISVLAIVMLFACGTNNTSGMKTDNQETTVATTKVVETTKVSETTKVLETSKVVEATTIATTEVAKLEEKKIVNGEKNMGKPKVEISIKDYGKIQLELEPEIAPITVANFLSLVNSKFYDGITFHRIIKGFMMQGGDPEGTGRGGSNNNIKGEFDSNGVSNPISHVRGVISMARRGDDNNSASSQFFIVHKDSTFLDGDYASFGRVISGMDVVDKVCETAKVVDRNGTVAEGQKPIIEYIKVIE